MDESTKTDSMEDVKRVAAVLLTMGTLLLICINILSFVKRVMERYSLLDEDENVPEERTAKPARPCGCDD